MALDTALRKLPEEATTEYRQAPHNVEAEQALLGAVLVNNEAFYRVSDFLEPRHFYEPIHQKIYEVMAGLIRAGKIATPVTLKTFLPPDADIAGLSPAQYLARLAAEATTVINAEDYGRTIYDLAVRRDLIRIGEDLVNVAYDAPVDLAPQVQIEDAERRLYELAETGRYEGVYPIFRCMKGAIDLAARPISGTGISPALPPVFVDLDQLMGGLQASDLVIIAGRPGMGKTALATNVAYKIASEYRGKPRPTERFKRFQRGNRRFLLPRNVCRAARYTRHLRADRRSPRPAFVAATSPGSDFPGYAAAAQMMQSSRSILTRQEGCRSRNSLPAREG